MTLEKAGVLEEPSAMPSSAGAPSSPAVTPTRNPVEKRREARYETCDAVEVCILEAESQPLRGILRDVSRSGLRIELSVPVEAGTHLEVVLANRAIIFGEARYCRRSAHIYQVGVVIEDIYYPKSGPAASTQEERRTRSAAQSWSVETLEPGRHTHTVFSQRKFLGFPIARGLGNHVSPDDAAAFLHHELSETKTVLVERHLTACEECSTLMRMILEDYTSFVERFGNDTDHVQAGFGRVMLKDPEAPHLIRESAAVFVERSAAPEKTSAGSKVMEREEH
jgi:hypothetical protein